MRVVIRLAIFILLLVILAPTVSANDITRIVIYRDRDSLTIYVPKDGLANNVIFFLVSEGLVKRVAWDGFSVLKSFNGLSHAACFRLERAPSQTNLPQDCQSNPLITRHVDDNDAFWYDDAAQALRPILISNTAGHTAGYCSADPQPCVGYIAQWNINQPIPRLSAAGYTFEGDMDSLQGNYENAVAAYTQSIDIQPDYLQAYLGRALVHNTYGHTDLARADCDTMLSLDPNYAPAYWVRGLTYNREQKPDLAIANFTQAIALQPDYANPYFDRASLRNVQGDYAGAIDDYTQFIQMQPNSTQAYFELGRVYASQGDYDQAIADYNQMIAINPNEANAYWGLGFAYDALQRYNTALIYLQRYIELAGDYPEYSAVKRAAELQITPSPVGG